jgi:hypothetical protein
VRLLELFERDLTKLCIVRVFSVLDWDVAPFTLGRAIAKLIDDNSKFKPQKKEYTPIKSYKPSGNLVYDDDILNKFEGKFFK